MMKHDQTQIVIIGAGYAGLIAARRLAWKTSRNEVAITLVNGTERFVERINLHKFAANQPVGQPMIQANLRKTGVHFVQGWVTGIQPAECSLTIQTGSETSHLNYDYLLFALGSTMDREGVPGVREHAYVLTPSGERSAQVLRESRTGSRPSAGVSQAATRTHEYELGNSSQKIPKSLTGILHPYSPHPHLILAKY